MHGPIRSSFIAVVAVLTATGCSAGSKVVATQTGCPATGLPSCMNNVTCNLTDVAATAYVGYSYSGTCTASFSPALTGTVYLTFQSDIGVVGSATTNGTNPVTFPMAGSTEGICLYNASPTTIAVYTLNFAKELAASPFTWNAGAHC
jgi:hypothetical protein